MAGHTKAGSIDFVPEAASIDSTPNPRVSCNRKEYSMKYGFSLAAVGHATSLFLVMTFVLCVGFDLLFPTHAMFRAWHDLLPGFHWICWTSFVLGAIESYAYGWYVALIWVPIYNVVTLRRQRT
jgi:hypothetical protein